MSKSLLRPSLHLDWPGNIRPVIQFLAQNLYAFEHAGAEDLLGFSLGHGVGECYIDGAVTEYQCAFVGTGDGRSCDGTVNRLAPRARVVIDNLTCQIEDGDLAWFFHDTLDVPTQEFETVHFADFTVVVLYDACAAQPGPPGIRIFADPARDARDAGRRAAGIEALFAFLGEFHTMLNCYRYDLPTPDMLRHAA